MKLIILALILNCFTFQAFTQGTVKIKGSCPLIKDGTELTLVRVIPRRFGETQIKIKTKSIGNTFTFETNAEAGELYALYVKNNFARLYLEPGKANILIADSTLRTVITTGNNTGIEYEKFTSAQIATIETKAYNLGRVNYFRYLDTKNTSSEMREQLSNKVDSLTVLKQNKDVKLTLDFIKAHPSSYLNTYLLYLLIDQLPEEIVKKTFKKIPARNIKNTWGIELQYRIDNLFLGAKAPAFTQTDTAGHLITLSSFRGKYLLLDFWASWCVPCRADNPNLITAINEYGGGKFAIASISLDSDKVKWIQAIKDDKLTSWTHLSDLKAWNNGVSSKYYVYAVPDNYLIDPNGVIVAKNIHGDELLAKLKELIK